MDKDLSTLVAAEVKDQLKRRSNANVFGTIAGAIVAGFAAATYTAVAVKIRDRRVIDSE